MEMEKKLATLLEKAKQEISEAKDLKEIENLRIKYLGKKR